MAWSHYNITDEKYTPTEIGAPGGLYCTLPCLGWIRGRRPCDFRQHTDKPDEPSKGLESYVDLEFRHIMITLVLQLQQQVSRSRTFRIMASSLSATIWDGRNQLYMFSSVF